MSADVTQVICGMSTATFGGAVRDVVTQKPVRIMHSHAEIYASTAAAGASTYLVARSLGAPVWGRIVAGVGSTVVMRYLSWTYGIRLATWTDRDERKGDVSVTVSTP